MGQFIRTLLASCLGVFIALGILIFIGVVMIGQLASLADQPEKVNPNSVLVVKLADQVPDRTNNVQTTSFDFNDSKVLGLQEIIASIKNAKEDDNIKGIYIAANETPVGFASTIALRNAIKDFKSSGKFVYAHAKYYSQGGYFLASVADKISINPIGMIDLRGFGANIPFYKDMLDKVGVKVEVFYAGKFKSATEPVRRTDMSPENREQIREYLDDMYQILLGEISETRSMSVEKLKGIIDQYVGAEPNKALAANLVDIVGYKDMIYKDIREQLGIDEDKKIKFVSLRKYIQSNPIKVDYKIDDKIAVVYAEGTIVDGTGEYGSTGDYRYTKIIESLEKKDEIKALVLRVNSPGGSAMASENIWRSLTQLKEKRNIPIVVSMGDYAASGGYYIACPADTIVAQPSTLTGSIGVFSIFPIVDGLMENKLGITSDTVSTGALSNGFSPNIPLSEFEKSILQNRADSLYSIFLRRVSAGRNMPVSAVNEIAQGRVWTGTKAVQNGLVDVLGDLDKALEIAGNMADLESYRTVEYPKVKDPLQQLLDEFTQNFSEDEVSKRLLQKELGDWYHIYQEIKDIKDFKGAQMRLPYRVPFK